MEHERVSYCSCKDLSYVHAHCPCWKCKGRAISRSTEHRHRQLASTYDTHTPTPVAAVEVSIEQDDDPGNGYDDCSTSSSYMEVSISPHSESTTTPPALEVSEDTHICTPPPGSVETELQHEHSSVFGQDVKSDIVLISVLRAFELLEEMNGSQKNFLNVLKFGRDMYCKNDQSLLRLWPTTWSACMNVLKEAGYKEPTLYYVCLNGKSSKFMEYNEQSQ